MVGGEDYYVPVVGFFFKKAQTKRRLRHGAGHLYGRVLQAAGGEE